MASIVASMVSNPEEQKWASEIDDILKNQFRNEVETPSISLFQVPQTITIKKPEAYEPQHIGLGPIHHFRPQPYKKMEQKKLTLVRKVLKDYEINDYEIILMIVDMVQGLLPAVRSSYDMFLQVNDDTLARIFAIDGLLLLNLLQNSQILENNIEENRDSDSFVAFHDLFQDPQLPKVISPKRRLVAQDVIMVENQIPVMVLKIIQEALYHASNGRADNFSTSMFRTFCEIHSPLELMSDPPPSADHLLHYMYYSIINNISVEKPSDQHVSADQPQSRMEDAPAVMDLLFEAYNFANKIPQKEIVQAYEQTILVLETFSHSKKNLIPSASHLHEKAGYSFSVLDKREGIKRIHIDEKHVIYLPYVTLNTDSEVIFRNLVAFETLIAKPDDFPLTEYVTLMCALIMNIEDVKLLRKQKVIRGDLGDVEVVKLFNSLSSSMPAMKAKGKSMFLQVMIDDITNVYESSLRVKTYLFLRNVASRLLVVLKAIGGFVGASWKIVAFVISIVTVFCLLWQAYCDSFGCDKTTLTLLPYSSS